MRKNRLGRTNYQVSVLGFGASQIGFERADLSQVERILASAADCGVNVIDTAECYADSEELIGRALQAVRKNFYIFTKCGHDPFPEPAWDAGSIRRCAERSLQRLRVEQIHLLQLHSCDLKTLQMGECIGALQQLKDEGKIAFAGYSGDGDAARHAALSEFFDVIQTTVNIVDQNALDEIIPAARRRDAGVIAKRPLANVAWRAGSRRSEISTVTALRRFVRGILGRKVHYAERLEKLALTRNLDEDSMLRLALRFCLSIDGVDCLLTGTTNEQHLIANARLCEAGPLAKEEFEELLDWWRSNRKANWTTVT